jgi:hypothetical protein
MGMRHGFTGKRARGMLIYSLPDCTRIHLGNTRDWGEMVQEGEGKKVELCRRCKSTRSERTEGTCGGDGGGSGGAGRRVAAAASLVAVSPYPGRRRWFLFSEEEKEKEGTKG